MAERGIERTRAIQYRGKNIFLTGVIALLAGCAGTRPPPTPLAPPGILTQFRTFLGTPLSGPLANDNAGMKLDDTQSVTVSFFALEKIPADMTEPLASHIRLIVASRENSPVLPSARLTSGVRFMEVDNSDKFLAVIKSGKLGKAVLIWSDTTPLLPDATVDFGIRQSLSISDVLPGEIAARKIALDLYRPAPGGIGAGILMDGYVNTAPPREIEESFTRSQPNAGPGRRNQPAQRATVAPSQELVLQSETALFDRHSEPDAYALLVPVHFDKSVAQAVLILVDVERGSADADYLKRVAAARTEVEQSARQAAAQAKLIGVDPTDWPGLSSAVESLAFADRQRAALLFLSQQTGAEITQDVTLSATDTILSQLSAEVRKAIATAPSNIDRASVGWICERATLGMLMQFQSGGKLPPELAAILAHRAGQAGRNSGTLEEVLSNAASRQDMENRLAAENYIFLEDSSPAARVRAFDWLTMRHLAPPGYDPLASSKERRAALEQAEQSANTTQTKN
jgi:hypothetical protein